MSSSASIDIKSAAGSSNSTLTREKRKVDPNVLAAIQRATPPKIKHWRPMLRLILFQLYFFPTSFIAIPLYMLRCIIHTFV